MANITKEERARREAEAAQPNQAAASEVAEAASEVAQPDPAPEPPSEAKQSPAAEPETTPEPPETDAEHGDLTPAFVAWYRNHRTAEEFEAKYGTRNHLINE